MIICKRPVRAKGVDTPPSALPNLTEDFLSKCLNVVKNENVLLDPNSEALCPYGLLPFADNIFGKKIPAFLGGNPPPPPLLRAKCAS